MTALFIGVVSHENSRFSSSQGPDGLAHQLARTLADRGVSTDVRVNTADLHDPTELPVTPAMVQASLTEQVRLDARWSAFLGVPRGARWWARRALRWARRGEQSLRPPDTRMVERLLNIELSHLDLLRHGLETGSDWILVLEDDAASMDVDDCADGLAGLLTCGPRTPAYVNVSQSFSNAELGIEHLLTSADAAWQGHQPRRILVASRPVTNTVCAILYRSAFAALLVQAMDALPMEPVVPIDWKLNLALMDLFDAGAISSGDCWLVDPAPIDQLSMRTGS